MISSAPEFSAEKIISILQSLLKIKLIVPKRILSTDSHVHRQAIKIRAKSTFACRDSLSILEFEALSENV